MFGVDSFLKYFLSVAETSRQSHCVMGGNARPNSSRPECEMFRVEKSVLCFSKSLRRIPFLAIVRFLKRNGYCSAMV